MCHSTWPAEIVTAFSVSAPPELPSTMKIRKLLLLPAIVAPLPFTVIGVTTTGRPLPPTAGLFAAVSEYVQPAARLIDPPPAALTAFTATTSPAPPAEHETFTEASAPAAVEATR